MKEVVDFVVLAIIYFAVFYRKWCAQGRDVLLMNTLMYIYLVFVLYFTLMPIVTSLPFLFDHAYQPMNLVPFIDVSYGRGDCLRQLALNVVMTVPFGFMLPLTGRRNSGMLRTIIYTFLLSLAIEMIQPLISSLRTADITDLITNVLGGVIGYGFYLVLRPLSLKILTYIRESGNQASSSC